MTGTWRFTVRTVTASPLRNGGLAVEAGLEIGGRPG